MHCICIACITIDSVMRLEKKNYPKKLKTLWPHFFMDGVQLPQGQSHFEEAVQFLPLSSQVYLEECKYKIKKIQMSKFINTEQESESESESEPDTELETKLKSGSDSE